LSRAVPGSEKTDTRTTARVQGSANDAHDLGIALARIVGKLTGRAGNNVGRADRRVRALVAGWPTAMRQVFTLRKVYEQSPAEIARTLGLSESDVERHRVQAALACGGCRGQRRHVHDPDVEGSQEMPCASTPNESVTRAGSRSHPVPIRQKR
jgi:hypothetical protein